MTARCGFVAVVGTPNAGKSTLLNRLTGAKLSIVTPKAQTTRFRVLGILMRGESQVLLVDTPGIFTPRRKLDRAMVAAAWTGVQDADLTLLLVDAKTGATDAVRQIVGKLAVQKRRSWLVLNKIDLVPPQSLLPLTAALAALAPFGAGGAGRAASVSRRRSDGSAGSVARSRDRARTDLPADA
jgi:GTP-binding protein Era